jgi:hypothetical protein
VSRITAGRFVRTLVADDFLRRTSDGFVVSRRGDLVRAWVEHARRERAPRLPVRWVYGPPPHPTAPFKMNDRIRCAVGGFEACAALGVQHASFGLPEVHVEGDLERALETWDLVRCDARDAHVVLRRAPFPQSVFRATSSFDGVPVVDVLQAALDVSRHAARGREQADYIFHDVLGWRDV